jgi:hypothetical protein
VTTRVEDLTQALLADLQAVHERVLGELDALARDWYGLQPPARYNQLLRVEAEIRAMIQEAEVIAARRVVESVHASYDTGGRAVALHLGQEVAFSSIDVDAVTHLAQDTMRALLRATRGMSEDVKQVIQDLVREHVRDKLYTGRTAIQAGRDLAASLRDRGITAIVYSDGRQVSLPTYAEMVVRTKTAEAYQEAGFNQGERLGIDWWEVMDGPDCGWTHHDDPRKADGMIVPLDDARAHPLSHPNCRRVTTPRPDILHGDGEPMTPTDRDRAMAIADAADKAHRAAQREVKLSPTPVRRTAQVSVTEGVAPSAAARRFAMRVTA